MRSRLVFPIATAVAVMLALVLSACSAAVDGSPSAAQGADSKVENSGSAKSSTTSPKTTKDNGLTTPASPKEKPTSDIKIAQKKKVNEYDACNLLTPEEVADAVGSEKSGEKGCMQTTTNPTTVVLVMFSPKPEGESTPIEVGGNTAYQTKEEDECTVSVMLTDEPRVIFPAFMVSVSPIDDVDSCAIALKLATKGFEKIPNA